MTREGEDERKKSSLNRISGPPFSCSLSKLTALFGQLFSLIKHSSKAQKKWGLSEGPIRYPQGQVKTENRVFWQNGGGNRALIPTGFLTFVLVVTVSRVVLRVPPYADRILPVNSKFKSQSYRSCSASLHQNQNYS